MKIKTKIINLERLSSKLAKIGNVNIDPMLTLAVRVLQKKSNSKLSNKIIR